MVYFSSASRSRVSRLPVVMGWVATWSATDRGGRTVSGRRAGRPRSRKWLPMVESRVPRMARSARIFRRGRRPSRFPRPKSR